MDFGAVSVQPEVQWTYSGGNGVPDETMGWGQPVSIAVGLYDKLLSAIVSYGNGKRLFEIGLNP